MAITNLVAVAHKMLFYGVRKSRNPKAPRPTTGLLSGRPRVVECVICWRYPEGYMAKDEVWEAAGLDPNEQCCLLCLEQLLARPLTIADLTNAPINTGYAFFFMKGAAHSKDCEN